MVHSKSSCRVVVLDDIAEQYSEAHCFQGWYNSRDLLERRVHYLCSLDKGQGPAPEKYALLGDGIYGLNGMGGYTVKVAEVREER